MGWNPIANGQAINITAGSAYTVVASVRSNHTEANIRSIIASKGLTLYAYAEGPEAGGYRNVSVSAVATQSGASVPWSAPWPFGAIDDSHIISALVWPDAGSSQPAAPVNERGLPPNQSAIPIASLVVVSVGLLGGAAWYIWRVFR